MIATFYALRTWRVQAPWTSWITPVPTALPALLRPPQSPFQLVTLGGILMVWLVLELTERWGDAGRPCCSGCRCMPGVGRLPWLQRERSCSCARAIRGVWRIFTRLRNERGQLLAYMVWINVTMLVAQAYFTAFVLRHLHMPYWQFVSLLGTEFLAKIAGLALFGELAHRRGARALLQVAGLAMVPVTALWLMWPQFWYLVAVQVLSGLALGAYELATGCWCSTRFPTASTSVMTTYNLLTRPPSPRLRSVRLYSGLRERPVVYAACSLH